MKTKKIRIKTIEGLAVPTYLTACGECFKEVDKSDDYCRDCGAEFAEDWAYSKEDLLKFRMKG